MGVNVMNGVKETNHSADYGTTSGTSGKIGRGVLRDTGEGVRARMERVTKIPHPLSAHHNHPQRVHDTMNNPERRLCKLVGWLEPSEMVDEGRGGGTKSRPRKGIHYACV